MSARRRGRRCVPSPALPSPSRGRTRARYGAGCSIAGGGSGAAVTAAPYRSSRGDSGSHRPGRLLTPPSRSSKTPRCGRSRWSSAATHRAAESWRRRTTSPAASASSSAMSSAEALRRCPDARRSSARGTPSTASTPRSVWSAIREVVPRVEQVGIDEGYLDLGTVVSSFAAGARRRAGGADVGPGRDVALLLARRLDLEGRLQGRLGPAQARRHHGRAHRGARRGSSRRSRCARCPGSAPRPRNGSRPRV